MGAMPTLPPEHPSNGADAPEASSPPPVEPAGGRPIPAAPAERAAAPPLEAPWLDAVAAGGRGRSNGNGSVG